MWVLYWHIHLKNSGCQHHHLGHLLQSKTELFNILVPTLAQVVMEARIVAVCFMIIKGAVRGKTTELVRCQKFACWSAICPGKRYANIFWGYSMQKEV